MKKMMENTLTRTERIGWVLSIPFGLFFLVLFSYVAVTVPPEFPSLGRLMFIGGAIFGAVEMGLAIWTLTRKSFNRMRHENMVHRLVFGFLLVVLICVMVLGGQLEDRVVAIQMLLNVAVFFMIFGIPAMFILRINRTESALREHLLKVELKVAELADAIRQKK